MTIQQLFDVTGRSAIVTGGASGLGLGIARALAENGAHVTIADIDQAAIDKALPQLGPDAKGEVLDVTARADVDRVFDAIDAARDGIDVVFVNAGIAGGPGFGDPDTGEVVPIGTIDGSPDTEWDQVIGINLTGTRNTLAAAARVMKARGRGGRLIVTSSIAAIANVPFVSSAYHASKAGVAHLARQAAVELAPYGILVNSIAPANFVTNIADGAMHSEPVQALFARGSLLKRTATVDEIAGMALFLSSDASSYVTGVELPIDGGTCLSGPYLPR